jgi:hypothetical protein
MTKRQLFGELLETAKRIGIGHKYAKGDFDTGLVIINEEKIFMINKSEPLEKSLGILKNTLLDEGIEGIWLKPP